MKRIYSRPFYVADRGENYLRNVFIVGRNAAALEKTRRRMIGVMNRL